MKIAAVTFAIVAAAICGFVAWNELASPQPRLVELGNLVVLSLSLVVLILYAYDTNSIARVTRDRWVREGILATTYNMAMPDASVGDSGHTVFQLRNGSPLIVRAAANFNFKVYGSPMGAGPLYEGKEKWLLYPNQHSQGWFKVEQLLRQQGKTVASMQAEVSEENRKRQLTMMLELTFWYEFGDTRTFPPASTLFRLPTLGMDSEPWRAR